MKPTQEQIDRALVRVRRFVERHGLDGVNDDEQVMLALADDLKAAREEHLTSDMAGLRLAERVTALTADRDSWRRVCETLQAENAAMAALLEEGDRIVIDSAGLIPDAHVPRKQRMREWLNGLRAILAVRAKRMGETGGGA